MLQRLALISWMACTLLSGESAWGQVHPDAVSAQHASRPASNGTREGVEQQRQVHFAGPDASLVRKFTQASRDRTRKPHAASVESPAFASSLDIEALTRRLVAGVLLSIALFVALLFLRTGKLRPFGKHNGDGTMELLDTLMVAPRCCLHLVRIQDQVLVVGRDATGMRQVVPIHGSFESHLLDALPEGSLAAMPTEPAFSHEG